MVKLISSESLELKVAAKRMWEGLVKDAHNCLPKAFPDRVLGIDYPLGQLGFSLPGDARIIKYYTVVEDDLAKAEEAAKVFYHKEVAHASTKLVKVFHEEGVLMEEEIKRMEEDPMPKNNSILEKEIVGATHKAIKEAEKVLKKEANVGGEAVHKVGKPIELDVKEVKEKIEEVDHEAHKITTSVSGGGMLSALFLHYKHTIHLQDTKEGESILHWTSEVEALSKSFLSLEEHKKHVLDTFHHVETYLSKHIDHYAHL